MKKLLVTLIVVGASFAQAEESCCHANPSKFSSMSKQQPVKQECTKGSDSCSQNSSKVACIQNLSTTKSSGNTKGAPIYRLN
jgi:hypothetical protein